MKQLVQNYRTGKLELQEVPVPMCKPGGVLVRNMNSVVSVGTERSVIEFARKGLIGKAKRRPDLLKQAMDKAKKEGLIKTFKEAMSRLDVPTALGYSSSGRVIEVASGVDEFAVGDRVACAGAGYASHAEVIFVPKNLCVKIPESVGFEEAAFVMLGSVAVHGVRTASLTFGEEVAVIGLGLLGLLTVQILKAAGCRVLGADIDSEKVKLAKELGADNSVISNQLSVIGNQFSKGQGMDAVIITAATRTNKPIELAAEISRFRGRVVMVGVSRIDIPRQAFWEKELDFRVSKAGGPGILDPLYELKGIDYPVGYVRWTQRRNMEEFLDLVAQGKVKLDKIITHKFRIEEAVKAYDMIVKNTEPFIGVLLEYPRDGTKEEKEERRGAKVILEQPKPSSHKPLTEINVGLIGAGLHAKTALLPALKKILLVNLRGVATATGVSGRHITDKFGFEYCTSNYEELLNDSDIDCVMIATRHNLHARLVVEALKQKKAVFVEKPLAINEEELLEIIKTYNHLIADHQSPRLMVGYNRRFSPFAVKAKDFFATRGQPMVIDYRVNAGFIPKDHWVHDPLEGGGRIIGEVCHFVDLIGYLTNSSPIRVYARRISGTSEAVSNSDNIIVNLDMADGSIASITYAGCGDKSFSKERVEVFAQNSVCVIDDFRKAMFIRNGRAKSFKKINQDLGYLGELKAFFQAVGEGGEIPVLFEEYILSSLVTFKIVESLQRDVPIDIDLSE